MNAHEVIAVVLSAETDSAVLRADGVRVSVGGLASLVRVRRALAEAGMRDAYLVSGAAVDSAPWSAVASASQAVASLPTWSKGRAVLLLCGDLPLLTAATVRQFLDAAAASHAKRFVEATGVMAVFASADEAGRTLDRALGELKQGSVAHTEKPSPCGDGTWRAPDLDDVRRLSAAAEYGAIARIARRRKAAALAAGGVLIVDPERTYVDDAVSIGRGTVLGPDTHIVGESTIGAGCAIGPSVWIESSAIEDGAKVWYSVVEGSRVRARCTIGPFAHLRPESDIGPDARVGNFVEVKASRLGPDVKAGHLAYIGDADVGARTNIGAGAITCNYDGETKHRTVIGEAAFVGTNVSLVAPVTVGDGAFLAAGSTITEDVPPGALAIARARQVNKHEGETSSREDA